LRQQHIARGGNSCWTRKGMKVMLQCQFDPPLNVKKKITVVGSTKFLDTKQIVRSSWTNSIVGNECLKVTGLQFVTIKYSNKKVVNGADQHKDSMNAAKFSSSKQCEKKSSTIKSTKIFSPCEDDRTNYSTAAIEVRKNVSQHAENSCTHLEQVVQLSCDASTEHHFDTIDDASNGLSLLAQGVQYDGTAVPVKGQCHDKVCKFIIDGGSFTDTISSDLVAALSLSTRRLPMPRYMQWMNQSGMLKITMDCNVAPLSACHLLLG
jgi:hypothetical protein